jgi:hypothetical protein
MLDERAHLLAVDSAAIAAALLNGYTGSETTAAVGSADFNSFDATSAGSNSGTDDNALPEAINNSQILPDFSSFEDAVGYLVEHRHKSATGPDVGAVGAVGAASLGSASHADAATTVTPDINTALHPPRTITQLQLPALTTSPVLMKAMRKLCVFDTGVDGGSEDDEDEDDADAVAAATAAAEALALTYSTSAAEALERTGKLRTAQLSTLEVPPLAPPPSFVPKYAAPADTAGVQKNLTPPAVYGESAADSVADGKEQSDIGGQRRVVNHVKTVADYVLSLPDSNVENTGDVGNAGAAGGANNTGDAAGTDVPWSTAVPPSPCEKRMVRVLGTLAGPLSVVPSYEFAPSPEEMRVVRAVDMASESDTQWPGVGRTVLDTAKKKRWWTKMSKKQRAATVAKESKAHQLKAKDRRGRLATTMQLRFEEVRLRLLAAGVLSGRSDGTVGADGAGADGAGGDGAGGVGGDGAGGVGDGSSVGAKSNSKRELRLAAKRERIAALQELKRLKVRSISRACCSLHCHPLMASHTLPASSRH